ncbi:NACHT domain-containing protein [Streptomyces sp. NPDC051976]|uniref:NACHT domain-containing protein n=1 Tax=Streptomyces sp. NPDC051976 TaxID=3154947 RepID=UPI0034211AE3
MTADRPAPPRVSRHPARRRLAVVRSGGHQGSGYLLTGRLVLTAAHLLSHERDIRVTALDGHGEAPCTTVASWYDHATGLDVALLASDRPLTDPAALDAGPLAWAKIGTLAPIPGCQAVGFPYGQRDAAGGLDTEQLIGTYKPGSGLVTGRDVIAVDGVPPEPRPDGISPWAGMSGAAVFTDGVLLGVVTSDPRGWRHGRVTVTPVQRLRDEPGFLSALDAVGYLAPSFVDASCTFPDPTAEFESRYAGYVAKRHGTLRIFGIDLTDRRRATWPLDAAYYSLEAAPTALRDVGGWQQPPRAAGPVPAEQALAGHERVLLRGVAGSGKTTLVQWLAVAAAGQELSEHQRHLTGLVPFVLPLRTVARRDRLPAPADFLEAVGAPLTAPAGWVERILADRRALVLVDGLDEIDERARERVGDWLRDLLAAYPGNHWLVTSRPSAVADRWLSDEGFTELTLSPMSRRDVRAFAGRWHDAARAATPDDTEELARLDDYQRSLLAALDTKHDLGRLATNPLMCGLICALHRDRGGYLPTGRKELYDAALSMLLLRRDRERDLAPPLTEAPQIQLLQKLAYWLVRNGQAEMDREDAVGLVTTALPAMPAAAAVGDGPAVYRYLLERSGLLREPTADTVDFVHRTFQDYLAARAAVEERDFELMARNAHHDQWSDVIRMAVANARPDERARLLRKILARGDRTKTHRGRLHLLAMACLEHATELDPAVRAAVEERGAALIPPRSYAEAEALAAVGPLVLELLPGPEGLDEEEATATIETAALIGGDAAVGVMRRFAGQPPTGVKSAPGRRSPPDVDARQYPAEVLHRLPRGRVHHALGRRFPPGVDARQYATEVLDRLPRDRTTFAAQTAEQVEALAEIGGVVSVSTGVSVLPDVLARIGANTLEDIYLSEPMTDETLSLLADLSGLRRLAFFDCSRLTDLSPLADGPFRLLTLCGLPPGIDLGVLRSLTALRSLALRSLDSCWPGPSSLPAGLGVTDFYTDLGERGLEGVERLTKVEQVEADSATRALARDDWDRLHLLPRLDSLSLGSGPTASLDPAFPALPNVQTLTVSRGAVGSLPTYLAELFPAARRVTVAHPVVLGPHTFDLAPLAAFPELSEVVVRHQDTALEVLTDALPPRVTVTITPRPRA